MYFVLLNTEIKFASFWKKKTNQNLKQSKPINDLTNLFLLSMFW